MRRLRGRCGPDVTVQLTPLRGRFRPRIEVHMTQRMEQSRRQLLSLAPEQAPPAPYDVPEDPEDPAIEGPVLRLLPQPAPLGPEERVEL